MQIPQQQSSPVHWRIGSISPQENQQILTMMPNRINHPLIFSIDDRLSEQHLTRLDLSSKNLQRIDKLPDNIHFNVILLDQNELTKLEHLDNLPQLIQLSISHNQLNDIRLLNRLQSIQKLNLSYNLIDSIDSLKTLQNLVMLNVSNNNIHSIGVLNNCPTLQSLDVSENSIRYIEDLSHMTSLKYLNLHKNFIDTLNLASRYWPKSLHTLVISDNEIQDLTEISYLGSFINLNTLYIVDNPCLSVVDERRGCHQPFDYRPYVLNWCLSINNLDGIFITRKESLKAEWLLSQGKGRAFVLGEHAELVQYLTRVCGTDVHERDDLHLSRIILQQDHYSQQRQEHIPTTNKQMFIASDTIKSANETLSKSNQGRLQQSVLISESEFIKIHSSTSSSTDDEPITLSHARSMRTPSPGDTYSANVTTIHLDDQITENSFTKRYTTYDDRPIKPLDQHMLQTKLNQYPVDNSRHNNTDNSHPRAHSNPQQIRRTSSHLSYNANRYSPKTTASSTLPTTLNHEPVKLRSKRIKDRRRNSTNPEALRLLTHPFENVNEHLTTTVKVKPKEQQPSIEHNGNDDDKEIQMKSAPINILYSTQNTTMDNTNELQKLTTSVETMRTSILQAYLDLHERFTKTTELQTSALTALWKKCETQSLTHQRETEKIIQENRSLHQRIGELETHLKTNETTPVNHSPNPTAKHNPNLYPPLRAHISKRDAKSFFLHWIPNPLNEQHTILGYRIYIDDILKGALDPGRFETIIDSIRDEGEYKIKIRTYDQYGESADSNSVVARFRRQQHQTTPSTDSVAFIQRTRSAHAIGDIRQGDVQEDSFISSTEHVKTPIIMDKRRIDSDQQRTIPITPEKHITKPDEHNTQLKTSPYITTNDNIISRKPPVSPTSSPSRTEKKSSNTGLSNKVSLDNQINDSSSTVTIKRSPARTGIMSRLTKSPYKIKQNILPLNVLPNELSSSPTDSTNTFNTQEKTSKRVITFQSDLTNNDYEQVPIRSLTDPQNSVNFHRFVRRSETLSSNSPSPPPTSEQISKDVLLPFQLDQ